MSKIYLDNAASTPIRKEVIEIMSKSLHVVGNPSSIHNFGKEARSLIERARISIAHLIGAESSEIIFTSSGTEANNFILKSAILNLGIKYIISSPIEHLSVLETLKNLEKQYFVKIRWLKLKKKGEIDLEDLENSLIETSSSTLVSLMWANNEIGNILDIEKVGQLCEKYKSYFHCDAVQFIGHYPLNLRKTSIDFISASAHKFYGPLGIGFCFIKKPIKLNSILKGGTQEMGLRAGGENLSGIVGMAKALELSFKNLEKEKTYLEELKKYCISKLKKEVPIVEFNGNCLSFSKSLYTILSLKVPFKDELLGFKLELENIALSGGSACGSGSQKNSHVMENLYDLKMQSSSSFLRVSFGIFNKKEEIDQFILSLLRIISPNFGA